MESAFTHNNDDDITISVETEKDSDSDNDTPLIRKLDSFEWRLEPQVLEKFRKEPDELKSVKSESIRKFYEQQNEAIDSFLQLELIDTVKKSEEDNSRTKTKIRIAIHGSFIINIILFCLKVVAAVVSGSLSVAASAMESSLDLVSGTILFLTNWYIKKENVYSYPAGKKRLEPIGIIVIAACMFTATTQIIISSVQQFIDRDSDVELSTFTIVIIAGTVVVKLIMWLYCRSIIESPSVQTLAQDHRNDVLSNAVGVTTALLGYYVLWWIDSLGGILIGLYIMANWGRTGYQLIRNLTGRTADPSSLAQLTYLVWNHDERIIEIDTVRAFYFGTGFMVEVDIVLPENMPLKEAHDIGESLQAKLEKVPTVERANVHLDWNSHHQPRKTKK